MDSGGNKGGNKHAPKTSSSAYNRQPAEQYDRERVVEEALAITAYYSGSQPETQGSRRRFRCPECGKDKLDINTETFVTGCWNEHCSVPQSDTAIGLVAYFEGLDPSMQFKEVLRKGYEAAAIQPEPHRPSPKKTSANAVTDASSVTEDKDGRQEADDGSAPVDNETGPQQPQGQQGSATRENTAFANDANGRERALAGGRAPGPTEHELDLADRVYRYVLETCELHKDHYEFWLKRGLTPETIAGARLGSIWKNRCSYMLRRIQKQFSEPELLSVPGFFKNDKDNLSFTFWGEFTLIPYHDGRGRISTIEARVLADKPKDGGKYRSLRESHNHVYLYPGTDPNDVKAFCEGPIGAIAAAQEGVAVGAIQGFKRYKGRPRFTGDERPPPEIEGADFGGETVPFIPDIDDPPQQQVLDEAPETARILAGLQNGRPATVRLPQGKDLDQYLLAMNKASRQPSLLKLLQKAHPTSTAPGGESAGAEDEQTAEHEAPRSADDPAQDKDGHRDNGKVGKILTFPGTKQTDWKKANATPHDQPAGQAQTDETGQQDPPPQNSGTASIGSPAKEQEENTHQALRPKPNPDPDDPEAWTRSVYEAHRQQLPSEAPVLRSEITNGLMAFAVVWASLSALVALAYLLCIYVASAAWSPGPIASAAASFASLTNMLTALVFTLVLSALVGALVTFREGRLRKEKREMLDGGEMHW